MGSGSPSALKHSSGGSAPTGFTVSIPKSMAVEAADAARMLGITKAQLVKRALAELLEDIQDAKVIEARRHEINIPWEKVKADLGL